MMRRSQFRRHSAARCMAMLPLALACWPAFAPLQSRADQPPNVLLILADDQTWSDSGCYGNELVKTPHIDRLAQQGLRFTHCFTATAMCAPTRQQLYTGVYPVRNGAYPNHSRVYGGVRSMVHHLGELGYRVGLCGKQHFKPAASFPFEKVPPNKLSEFLQRDAEQPFCLVYASHSPHLPWTAGDAAQYPADQIPLPPYLIDTQETRQALTGYYAEITDFDREVGHCMDLVAKAGQEQNTIFIYTSEQGAQLPRGKWTCYDTGLRTALVVRWPAKVEPDSVTDAMVGYVDILPTLIEAAGGTPTEIDTGIGGAPGGGRGFDGRSFLPVLLGHEQEHREYTYGVHTTRGIINGSESYPIRSIRSKTHKLIWNLQHEALFQNIVMRGDGASYWNSWVLAARVDPKVRRFVHDYRKRPEFELYDLREDPYELHNLAEDADQQALRKELHGRLQAWMRQQGDQGIATERKAKQRQGKGRQE